MGDIPPFATDCHIHVFGDPAQYPGAPGRVYTPVAAGLAEWRAIMEPLGFGRVVLVQPSAYGTDNRCMLDGLREAAGAARGIAVIDAATPQVELRAMHAAGVRGIRLNLTTGMSPDPAAVPGMVREAAARVAALGWHLQVLVKGGWVDSLAEVIPALGVPVVFDHMAAMQAALGPGQPGLAALLRLLREGRCWVKISGADYVASRREAPEEALAIMQAMVEANPERLVWGSDWPHIGPVQGAGAPPVTYLPIDHGALLDVLRRAAGEAMGRILVDNPAVLYGW